MNIGIIFKEERKQEFKLSHFFYFLYLEVTEKLYWNNFYSFNEFLKDAGKDRIIMPNK